MKNKLFKLTHNDNNHRYYDYELTNINFIFNAEKSKYRFYKGNLFGFYLMMKDHKNKLFKLDQIKKDTNIIYFIYKNNQFNFIYYCKFISIYKSRIVNLVLI